LSKCVSCKKEKALILPICRECLDGLRREAAIMRVVRRRRRFRKKGPVSLVDKFEVKEIGNYRFNWGSGLCLDAQGKPAVFMGTMWMGKDFRQDFDETMIFNDPSKLYRAIRDAIVLYLSLRRCVEGVDVEMALKSLLDSISGDRDVRREAVSNSEVLAFYWQAYGGKESTEGPLDRFVR